MESLRPGEAAALRVGPVDFTVQALDLEPETYRVWDDDILVVELYWHESGRVVDTTEVRGDTPLWRDVASYLAYLLDNRR